MVATAAILAPCAGAFERHVLHFGSLENGVDVTNLRNNLVEQLWETRGSRLPLRGAVQAHEIEEVEQRISIAVRKNKLLQSQRPDEFIRSNMVSRPLRMAI